jgi:hypothetical protein
MTWISGECFNPYPSFTLRYARGRFIARTIYRRLWSESRRNHLFKLSFRHAGVTFEGDSNEMRSIRHLNSHNYGINVKAKSCGQSGDERQNYCRFYK